ncbi:MAG: hypothetical protein ASUL_05056 [Candidatus Aramenus sulfurataquae]|jgi:hypothetical protein|uniref:Uncharacterized protein n=1 Tax=Candidatus Aramenus sulfurataquae TaxID=1326980 RepID=W7L6R6_9CREN|nr:MAG: hypothetical protein ASUL_05056 [Candidatus Aramenus sulfurataquae]
MEYQILGIILLSFLSNFIIYIIYRSFIQRKLLNAIRMLEYYNSRLERVVSPKRKEKVYKKVSSEIKAYNSRLYKYSFVQSVLLIAFYMVDLFVLLTYFVVPVRFPYYVPYLTLKKDGQYYLNLGYLLVFILSFILFTPISLRRPKII